MSEGEEVFIGIGRPEQKTINYVGELQKTVSLGGDYRPVINAALQAGIPQSSLDSAMIAGLIEFTDHADIVIGKPREGYWDEETYKENAKGLAAAYAKDPKTLGRIYAQWADATITDTNSVFAFLDDSYTLSKALGFSNEENTMVYRHSFEFASVLKHKSVTNAALQGNILVDLAQKSYLSDKITEMEEIASMLLPGILAEDPQEFVKTTERLASITEFSEFEEDLNGYSLHLTSEQAKKFWLKTMNTDATSMYVRSEIAQVFNRVGKYAHDIKLYTSETLQDPEVVDAIKNNLSQAVRVSRDPHDALQYADSILPYFPITDTEFYKDTGLYDLYKHGVIEDLKKTGSTTKGFGRFIFDSPIPKALGIFDLEEVKETATFVAREHLARLEVDGLYKFVGFYNEAFVETLAEQSEEMKARFLADIARGHDDQAEELFDLFPELMKTIINSDEGKTAVVTDCLHSYLAHKNNGIPSPLIRSALGDDFLKPEVLNQYIPEVYKKFADSLDISLGNLLSDYVTKVYLSDEAFSIHFSDKVLTNMLHIEQDGWHLTREEVKALYGEKLSHPFKMMLYPHEAELLKREIGDEFTALALALGKKKPYEWKGENVDPHERLLSLLTTMIPEEMYSMRDIHIPLSGQDIFVNQLHDGEHGFSAKQIFEILTRSGKNRHHTLHNLNKLPGFRDYAREAHHIPTDELYYSLIDQVLRDKGEYNKRTSLQYFTSLLASTNFNIQENLDSLQQYTDPATSDYVPFIAEFSKLYETEEAKREVFTNWEKCKFYADRMAIIQDRDTLKQLGSIENQKLQNYAMTLLTHKDSKIPATAIIDFALHPERYFDYNATHTPDVTFEKKKTSNLYEVPNLDLTPPELVEALVEGYLDTLRRVPALTVQYKDLPVINGVIVPSLRDLTLVTLGSQSQKIKPLIQDKGEDKLFKRTFADVRARFADLGVTDLKGYLAGTTTLPSDVDQSKAKEIENILLSALNSQQKWEGETVTLEAKIHRKDDPLGAVNGSDADQCDKFEDGKRVSYLFNFGTTDFSIRIVEANDGVTPSRSLSTGLLTDGINIDANIADLYTRYKKNFDYEAILSKLDRDTMVTLQPGEFLLDNQGVRPGADTPKYQRAYTFVDQHFFTLLGDELQRTDGSDHKKLYIGGAYTQINDGITYEKNSLVSRVPLMYSDNIKPDVGTISLGGVDVPLGEQTVIHDETSRVPYSTNPGVSAMRVFDVVPAAYLEYEIYHKTGLVQGLHNLQNTLLAAEINNAKKGRPNMSFKHVTKDGKLDGYMIAYEGKIDKDQDKPCIYVMDWATGVNGDRRDPEAALSILRAFGEAYKREYLENNIDMPIFGEFVEDTSYQFLKKDIESHGAEKGPLVSRLERITGREFVVKEMGIDTNAVTPRHIITITPKPRSTT